MTEQSVEKNQMKIFRAKDAPSLMEAGCMAMEPMSEQQVEGFRKLAQAGYLEGDEVKVLVDMPGFSLAHAWLKKDYPLTRHSHDSDCMYYIVAGSLRLGTEELGPRDCFFVPADVAYTYIPGPDGVEVLEMRHKPRFNFKNLTHSDSWWQKAEATCKARQQEWQSAVPPSQKFA